LNSKTNTSITVLTPIHKTFYLYEMAATKAQTAFMGRLSEFEPTWKSKVTLNGVSKAFMDEILVPALTESHLEIGSALKKHLEAMHFEWIKRDPSATGSWIPSGALASADVDRVDRAKYVLMRTTNANANAK
jgi:hypothetical protein